MSKRMTINFYLGLALVGLVVMQVFAYIHTTRNETQHRITENQNRLRNLEQISKLYQQMEVGRRGNLLADNYKSLQDMNNAIASIINATDKLSSGARENLAQYNRIDKEFRPVILENISYMNNLIELSQKKGKRAALDELSSPRGISIIGKFKRSYEALESAEQALLAEHLVADANLHNRLSYIIIAGTLLAVIAIIILFIMFNIYLDKRMEAEIKDHNQKQLFESILNCMGDGVLVRDMSGKFILQNPTAKKLIGDSLEKLQIYSEDGKTQLPNTELPLSIALKGKSLNNSIYFVKSENHPNGIYVNVSVRPLIDLDGKQTGGVAVFNDISEIKEAHSQLESFNYSVSHDLAAPLRSIVGFSQILEEECKQYNNHEIMDSLYRIVGATDKMKQVIEGLMELSKLKRAKLNIEKVNLSLLAKEIADDLRKIDQTRKVNFIIPNDLEAKGDRRLLSVVMTNLLNNAYKFTAKNPDTTIEFGLIKNNNKETFFIRDNGAGFDMRHVKKLFGPFERLHSHNEFPGTGIGLATVEQVIKRHNGEIWAHGEVNKGAIFYFTL